MDPNLPVKPQPVKPGVKTTEFYITILTNVAALCAALAGELPPKWAAIVGMVSTVGYALARGLAKN